MTDLPERGLTPESMRNIDLDNLTSVIRVGNQVSQSIANAINTRFTAQAATGARPAISNSTSGGTLVKTGPGYLVSISVTTASTATTLTGLVYDVASPANAGSTNAFAIIPSSGFVTVNWPYSNGLVVQPSTSGPQVVAVSFVSTVA